VNLRLFLAQVNGNIGGLRGISSNNVFPFQQCLPIQMTDPDQGGNRRGAIAGLAIAVVLLIVGLWLAHELTATSKMQDCLMSGRTNCNVISTQ
jgi:hypothetical protein